MLILQLASREFPAGHGCRTVEVAEPNAGQAETAISGGNNRQRLLDLADRLARVQALGGEYARVDFSPELAERVRRLRA